MKFCSILVALLMIGCGNEGAVSKTEPEPEDMSNTIFTIDLDATLDNGVEASVLDVVQDHQSDPKDMGRDVMDSSVSSRLDSFLIQDATGSLDGEIDSGADVTLLDQDLGPRVSDTVVTLVTGPDYPAIIFSVDMMVNGQPLTEVTSVLYRNIAAVVFDSARVAPDSVCEIHLEAWFYADMDDVDEHDTIVGTADAQMCEVVRNEDGTTDYQLHPDTVVWISFNGVDYTQEDVVFRPAPHHKCEVVLIPNEPCPL